MWLRGLFKQNSVPEIMRLAVLFLVEVGQNKYLDDILVTLMAIS